MGMLHGTEEERGQIPPGAPSRAQSCAEKSWDFSFTRIFTKSELYFSRVINAEAV